VNISPEQPEKSFAKDMTAYRESFSVVIFRRHGAVREVCGLLEET
jgi:hypothetical protein